jgi:hypothetical protein
VSAGPLNVAVIGLGSRRMLTKAFDKSARLKRPIPLPIDAE